jgi:DNA-binding FadR family transcriptional regulator
MPRLAPNVPLPQQVADDLRHRIASGEFPVGARLPTEHQLAEDFGVSRNSVREAVRSLVHAGLLRARAGDGTYVTASSDLAPVLARQLDYSRAEDVAEVRLLLEREAARLAAMRATPQQREALQQALDTRAATTTPTDYAAADMALHHLVVDASGNELLAELYRGSGGLESAWSELLDEDGDFTKAGERLREVDDAHAALVAAIVAADPDAAAAAVERSMRIVWAQIDAVRAAAR